MSKFVKMWRETGCWGRINIKSAWIDGKPLLTIKFGVIELRYLLNMNDVRRICCALLSDRSGEIIDFRVRGHLKPAALKHDSGYIDQDQVGAEEV